MPLRAAEYLEFVTVTADVAFASARSRIDRAARSTPTSAEGDRAPGDRPAAMLLVLPTGGPHRAAVDDAVARLRATLGELDLELICLDVVNPVPAENVLETTPETRHLRALETKSAPARRSRPTIGPVLGGGSESDLARAGDLALNLASLRVFIAGDELALRLQEIKLLRALMQRPGRVLSRRELLIHAWDYESWAAESWEAGRTVDVHVRRLRAKLGAEADRIVTVRGAGYRFDG